MCRAPVVHVSAQGQGYKGQILNKHILDIMFCLLCKSYTNGKKSLILFHIDFFSIMAGYPSNLAK